MSRVAIGLIILVLAAPAGAVRLVSRHLEPPSADHWARIEGVSLDGRFVLLASDDNDLVAGDDHGGIETFLYDLRRGTARRLAAISDFETPRVRVHRADTAAVSADGSVIVAVRDRGDEGVVLRLNQPAGSLELLSAGVAHAAPNAAYAGYVLDDVDITGRRVFATQVSASPTVVGTAIVHRPTTHGQVIFEPDGPDLSSQTLFQISLDGRYGFRRDGQQITRIDLIDGEELLVGLFPESVRASGNGQRIVFTRRPDSGGVRLFLRDLRTGETVRLASNPSGFGSVRLSVTGDAVLYGTYDEFAANWSYFIWDGETRSVDGLDGTDLDDVVLSSDGRLVAGLGRETGALHAVDVASGALTSVQPIDAGILDLRATDEGVLFTARGRIAGLSQTVHPEATNAFFLDRREIIGRSPVRATLENPASGTILSGLSTIRGWAFATDEPIRSITFAIDGRDYGRLPHGGPRDDVRDAFPGESAARQAGFGTAFNFNELDPGVHRIDLTITTDSGLIHHEGTTFVIAPVSRDYLAEPGDVDLSGVMATVRGRSVLLQDVQVDGTPKDIELQWAPAEQSFEVIEVALPGSFD